MNKKILFFETKVGTFYIGQSRDGRYHPIYNDESLGAYPKIWQATEDLAGDHTFSVLHQDTGDILDTSTLGIPEDPNEWEKVVIRT